MPPQETSTATAGAAAQAAAAAGEQEEGASAAATMPVPGLASLSLNEGGSGSSSPRARTESEGSSSTSSNSSTDGGATEQQQQRPQRQRERRQPPRPVRHETTTHRTVPLAQAIRPRVGSAVPSLVELALASIADNCDALVDVQGLDEGLAVRLLGLILARGKLDYRLCRVFMETSGHPSIAEAVAGLNLYDALSCQKVDGGGGGGFGGFSPGGCR